MLSKIISKSCTASFRPSQSDAEVLVLNHPVQAMILANNHVFNSVVCWWDMLFESYQGACKASIRCNYPVKEERAGEESQ